MTKKVLGLCRGRHDIPGITEYVYPGEVNPLDTHGLFNQAVDVLAGVDELDLYVTGLSVALLAVVNYCAQSDIKLDCYHYDRDSNTYYRQAVIHPEKCPFCHQPKGNGWYCQHCGST